MRLSTTKQSQWLPKPTAAQMLQTSGYCARARVRIADIGATVQARLADNHMAAIARGATQRRIHTHSHKPRESHGVFVYAFAEVDVCGVLVHVSEPKTETTNSGSRRSSMLVFLVDESEAVVAVEVRGSSAELMKAGLRVDSVVALQDITYRAYDGRTATHQCSWNDHAAVVAQSLPHVSTARATVSAWKSTAKGIECIDVSVVLTHTSGASFDC